MKAPASRDSSSPQKSSSSSYEELKDLFAVVEEGKRVWEATFDAIVDPVMIISQDFRIQRANLAAAQSAQMHVRDLIGKTCFESFAKRDSQCPGCPMQSSLQKNGSERERLAPFADGREFLTSAFPIPLRDKQELRFSVMQYQDMSAVRKLEDQLLQNEKTAALGLFASGIAHDINNPLSGVLAFAQLAMQDLDPKSQTYQDLQEIEKSALRCKKIVEDTLQFVKPSNKDEKAHTDLSAVVQKVLPNLQVQWKDFDYHLDIRLKKLTPVPIVVTKFEQVFTNILCNALQALKPGGEIRIQGGENDKQVFVEIQDSGEGIPLENFKKIFDPYFTTKGKKGGTGLGLPICYNIVREHGGRIEVKSAVGKGSTFRICLPKGGHS